MDVLIGCLHVVESLEMLNKIRSYILSTTGIGIMCYAVVRLPLLLKNKSIFNTASKEALCILSVSHGYKPISEMRRRKIISKHSTIFISDIDDSEKVCEGDEVVLQKARYIHKYSNFIGYFDIN
jgi:hypothetical protein